MISTRTARTTASGAFSGWRADEIHLALNEGRAEGRAQMVRQIAVTCGVNLFRSSSRNVRIDQKEGCLWFDFNRSKFCRAAFLTGSGSRP